MMGSSGSLARQSPLRLCPKAVYAMRSTKDSTTFTYGPDRSRYQKVQTRSSDNTTITTQYFKNIGTTRSV
jgi:hypothetical protein